MEQSGVAVADSTHQHKKPNQLIKSYEDEEREEREGEMEIGFPTDVKHLSHIGVDGTMTTFNVSSSSFPFAVDGCELDLSSAKDYHRKHRVCENHSKCPKVTVGGLERRFCQQCSRLHAVSEFDEKKRSCRKRLSHHNARRRKPQRDCNGRQHPNMLWNGLSLNTSPVEKYIWSPSYDTKPTQMESGFTLSFQRGRGPEEHLYAGISRSFSTFQTSGGFSAGRSNSQLPGKGVGEYSGGLHESQDIYSVLSLLSTSSDSHGTKHNPTV
ncbi:hypothetical protein F2Q70_00021095 [Brassica cretica]|uniref:SBP-type domain-containing protein n=1 Tax=Brassica cretica TaxID=69181 RepID=A0A8S9GTN3_BRACR|nr:hypothetical protein F2Q70_00021095 [Brassica cretica]